jgi:hypothetical protein
VEAEALLQVALELVLLVVLVVAVAMTAEAQALEGLAQQIKDMRVEVLFKRRAKRLAAVEVVQEPLEQALLLVQVVMEAMAVLVFLLT